MILIQSYFFSFSVGDECSILNRIEFQVGVWLTKVWYGSSMVFDEEGFDNNLVYVCVVVQF